MSILFGHPTGNPNSHHAALAHFEAGWLESLCVAWMPSLATLRLLQLVGPMKPLVRRLSRRHFAPLARAPKIQGRLGEINRLALRALGKGDERFIIETNNWLMETMARACENPRITAVHAYEDSSLLQFAAAKRLGKACIYELPVGYFAAWDRIEGGLLEKYADWVPFDDPASVVSAQQKREEICMADLIFVPSKFVSDTVCEFHPDRRVVIARYGVDPSFWAPAMEASPIPDTLTFLFAGNCSLAKGIPLLLEAWRAAGIKHAQLKLVGSWQLSPTKKKELPPGCSWSGPVSSGDLRRLYHNADVFVFPANFEGWGLVVGEALAAGLPVLTTDAAGACEIIDAGCGRTIPAGNLEALVEALRWFDRNREKLPSLRRAAQRAARRSTWEDYRATITNAVRPFVKC